MNWLREMKKSSGIHYGIGVVLVSLFLMSSSCWFTESVSV